jgi:hypothetical protein
LRWFALKFLLFPSGLAMSFKAHWWQSTNVQFATIGSKNFMVE